MPVYSSYCFTVSFFHLVLFSKYLSVQLNTEASSLLGGCVVFIVGCDPLFTQFPNDGHLTCF